MDHLWEKTLSSQEIFKGKIIEVRVEEVELPNGQKSNREIVKHPGAVAIITLTSENKLLLVRQYRKPLDRVIYEIPAGKLEPGENPLDCAKRELEEETGCTSASLIHIQSFYTSPGFADEIIHIYYADQLVKQANGPGLDQDEFLDLVEVTLEEAHQLIKEQKIYDAKTVFAVQYLQLKKYGEL
ncbi:NUDIX hydrolase [Calidifontibacillus erzurumensis]|uniref:NUDIX hydrolase n=1 Tax=Calidifontibacillus erzurumensis TaxID=2741433 RepID=A0A8J8K768_9BACI|nr:NUDIX hydrolase [Calidifontibacillus erzurumensis]NSL50436.1 NUDIX hydrolase [Calidifontibacillus erzurumensis]